jgi:MoxR-like ATPase
LGEAADRIASEGNVFFSERFLLPRPILRAVTSEEPVLLLVDEVDKADPEFEAFLLEVLADYAVTIPELKALAKGSSRRQWQDIH